MLFMIYRTSKSTNTKPCEQAFETELPVLNWVFNHETGKVEVGKPETINKLKKVWCIEINSIEELMAFKEDVGEDLIIKAPDYTRLYEIEIYDDYRE